MFSDGFVYLFSLSVCVLAPVTTPLSNFMYYLGTGKINHIQFIWHRTIYDDVLTVLTWFLHLTGAVIFYYLDASFLNFLYQVFLGTVIQHLMWIGINTHKHKENSKLVVPFWKLQYWDMWGVITVTLLPMSVGIYLV